MKRTTTFLALLAACAFAALAATGGAALSTATGSVASVDAAAKTLVVSVSGPAGDAHAMTFAVDDASKIVKDGAAISLAELKQGDKLTVTFKSSGGKNVVVNIGVQTKP